MKRIKKYLIVLLLVINCCGCSTAKYLEGKIIHPQIVVNTYVKFSDPKNSAIIKDDIYVNESYLDLIHKKAKDSSKCFLETNQGDIVCIMYYGIDVKKIEENYVGKYKIMNDLGKIYYDMYYSIVYGGVYSTGHNNEMKTVAIPTYIVKEVDIE